MVITRPGTKLDRPLTDVILLKNPKQPNKRLVDGEPSLSRRESKGGGEKTKEWEVVWGTSFLHASMPVECRQPFLCSYTDHP